MDRTLQQVGRFKEGSQVEGKREEDDDWEPATIKSFDAPSGMFTLSFEGGFVAKVPLSSVRFPDEAAEPKAAEPKAAEPKAAEPSPGQLEGAYYQAVGASLPAPPSKEQLEVDPEVKYKYIAKYKDAGNALFKEGRFDWAIKTYCAAVASLARECYPSRERMLWDYEARVPCAQCYSNAALCALKKGDCTRAAELCEQAMECRPEDSDLVKVLLRHGQALLGLSRPEEAKELLQRAAEKEPNNRPVRRGAGCYTAVTSDWCMNGA